MFTFWTKSVSPSSSIRSDWVGQMCVTVGFCVEAIYTPPPPSPYVREPSERAYTSNIHFLRENHLLTCWDQDIPILPQESWFLAFPKLLYTQIIFPPYPNLCERVECWGYYHLKHKSRSSSSTHHLLPSGEWCLLDWLGVTWEPPSTLWSWTVTSPVQALLVFALASMHHV